MSRIRANTITNQNANGAPNFPDGITVTGIVTATTTSQNITGTLAVTGDATFSGNVGIAGTLTYEDVTNIDSVGLITARSGIRIAAGSTVGPVSGIITYFGDGSQLTGISVDPSATASSAGFLKVLNASTPQIRLNNDASDGTTTRAFFGIATGSNNFINGSVANDTVLSARVAGDLLIGCGSTIRMRVSENGHVTKPSNPMFQARNNSSSSITVNAGVIPFQTVINNIGGHYNNSNYRFTAPVTGTYLFYIGWYVVSDTNHRVSLRVNGGDFSTPYINGYGNAMGGSIPNTSGSMFLYLTAGQYVDAYTDSAFYPYGTHLGWGGVLIG